MRNPGDTSPRDPKGNKNAVKHGYYSRLLSPAEKASLTRETVGWLDDEEIILRYLGGAIFERLRSESDLPLEKYLAAVRAIVLASGRIESMHRARSLAYPRLVFLRTLPLLRQLENQDPPTSTLQTLNHCLARLRSKASQIGSDGLSSPGEDEIQDPADVSSLMGMDSPTQDLEPEDE
jgi:hypothetical protein